MNNLHPIQMQILRELLFHPTSHFSKLNISGLSSDHFSHHIRELLKAELILKDEKSYSLTPKGKEFALHIDTDTNKIEKQPKVSVLLCPYRIKNGITEYAVQTRLKEPYFGYTGFMTGKVRYGETVYEATARELYEEMGLSGKATPLYVLHEMVYNKENVLLEDKFFHALLITNIVGELVPEIEGGRNQWMTKEQFFNISPKYHNEEEIFDWFETRDKKFKEKKYFIASF